MDSLSSRTFSDRQHADGRWSTRVVSRAGPVTRGVWNYLSLKRAGVDRLARGCAPKGLVLDLGAGVGAYCHWFLGRREATVVALDWSAEALRRIAPAAKGSILRVCADARMLPFRAEVFCAAYSVDTLGHVDDLQGVLDELLRVAQPGAPLFVHSECSDPQSRWPDRALIAVLGEDVIAAADGHRHLLSAAHLHTAYARRFLQASFVNPAGLLGWLLGYPEKYRPAFARARRPLGALVTGVFAAIKRLPVAGALLRLVNASTNRLEILIGLSGGGSCFAELRKPPAR